jgi:hypothetical protein
MSSYPTLDALAVRQHGLVTLTQCQAAGLTPRQIRLLADNGLLVGVRRGVFRWCGSPITWQTMAHAAVLAAGGQAAVLAAGGGQGGAVLSHRSAGMVWGFVDPHADGPLEITAAGLHRLRGVVAHRHVLAAGERAVRFGLPVTNVERTLLDLAEVFPEKALGAMTDEALRRRLTTVARLHAMFGRHTGSGRRRTAPMAHVLADRGAGYRPGANDWERHMDRLWDEWRLPPAERQYRIRAGGRTYRPDRAIVELRIAVDWNGREYHGTRGAFDADSDRRAHLIQAGWLPLDFTTNSPAELVIGTVRQACERQRRLLLPA